MNKQIDDAYQRHLNRNGKCYCGHTISCDCGDLSKEEFIEKFKMDIERYDQLVSDAFKSYLNKTDEYKGDWPDTLDEFVSRCKADDEFAKKWGLKIEERELSSEERYNLLSESEKKNFIIAMRPMMSPDDKYDEVHYTIDNYYEHIPKRAITIIYNDQTIESYENNS